MKQIWAICVSKFEDEKKVASTAAERPKLTWNPQWTTSRRAIYIYEGILPEEWAKSWLQNYLQTDTCLNAGCNTGVLDKQGAKTSVDSFTFFILK